MRAARVRSAASWSRSCRAQAEPALAARALLDAPQRVHRERAVNGDERSERERLPLRPDERRRARQEQLAQPVEPEGDRQQRSNAPDSRRERAYREIEPADEVHRLLERAREVPGI